jgi:alkaline phosphatase D
VSVEVEARQMTTRLRAISDAADPKASVSTLKAFAVESGRPGVAGA